MCYMINTNDLYCNITDNHLENHALTVIEPVNFFNIIDFQYIRILQEIRDNEPLEFFFYITCWLCLSYVFILELLNGNPGDI